MLNNIMTHLSDIIIPTLIFYIIGYGLSKKLPVYENFLGGAREGLSIVVKLVPTVIGLFIAVGVLRASGIFEFLGNIIGPAIERLGVSRDLVPLMFVKMFSSSAALGFLVDIFKTAGPDSNSGMIASIMLSSTETIFYTMSLYFISIKVAKTRYTFAGAFLATLVGIFFSIYLGSRI